MLSVIIVFYEYFIFSQNYDWQSGRVDFLCYSPEVASGQLFLNYTLVF